MRPVPSTSSPRVSSTVTTAVAPVAHEILAIDLPLLPDARRAAAVQFVCLRVDDLPDPTRLAVLAVAVAHRGVLVAPGGRHALRSLAARPVPLAGEFIRLVRSLATAYVWETWPGTGPDGAPGETRS